MTAPIDRLDWRDIAAQLDDEGFALLPGLLGPDAARQLARDVEALPCVPLTELGRGELFPFGDTLPAPWTTWRPALYRHLSVIANRWNERLDLAHRYPADWSEFVQWNRHAGQSRPQSHLNRLRAEDYLALHRCDEGEHVFPLQIVALLGEPGRDFEGGEFVMTEQRPRMQSRPMVLPLALGDAAIITTAARPARGGAGDYRVQLRHAISRVRAGQRVGLELSFDDTP